MTFWGYTNTESQIIHMNIHIKYNNILEYKFQIDRESRLAPEHIRMNIDKKINYFNLLLRLLKNMSILFSCYRT